MSHSEPTRKQHPSLTSIIRSTERVLKDAGMEGATAVGVSVYSDWWVMVETPDPYSQSWDALAREIALALGDQRFKVIVVFPDVELTLDQGIVHKHTR